MPKTLASFCRLCLTKTSSKVPVFGGEQENVTDLLALIELSINSDSESDAAVCFDCILTLEAFHQFKDQCHVNDEFLKTLPPKDSAEGSEASELEEDVDEDAMECDYLEDEDDDDDGTETHNSEEQGLVEDVEPPKKKVQLGSPTKKIHKAKELKAAKVSVKKADVDPLHIAKYVRKLKAKAKASSKKNVAVPKKHSLAIPEFPGPQPAEDDLPKLQDSYPDFFHFARGSRSLYYDLVYYGERYNSAIYGTLHTYWQCPQKKTLHCPAMVCVSNDYTQFERRYEHSHGELPTKGEPEVFTPEQALPTVFRICWHRVQSKKAREIAVSIVKKESATKPKPKPKSKPVSAPRYKRKFPKKPIPEIPELPGPQPSEDDMPKLLDSYPDFFHFERSHKTRYYDLVYYGERFNSTSFGTRNTYWYCAHRKKYKCPALIHVSNDYTKFERRYEHTHDDQKPRRNVELFTPRQALPTMFRISWQKVQKVQAKKLQAKESTRELNENELIEALEDDGEME